MEPFLYEMLFLWTYDAFPPIYQDDDPDLPKLPAYSTATRHAKHVFLEGLDSRVVMEILLHCTKVTNVAIWGCRDVDAYAIGNILKSRPIERLSMSFEDLFPSDGSFDPAFFPRLTHLASDGSFDPAFFPRLTHLELVDVDTSWNRCKNLTLLPELTHLSLTCPTLMFAQLALKNCRNIEIFILTLLGSKLGPFRFLAADKRVSTRLFGDATYDIEDWKEAAQGGRDFWKEAEEVVASRSRETVETEADYYHGCIDS